MEWDGEFWDSNDWIMSGKLEMIPFAKSEVKYIGEPRILSQTDFAPTEIMPKKPQENAGGGPIGSGLLSMEDAKLMREFLVSTVVPKTKELAIKVLSNPRFQGSVELVDGVGEMLVGSAVAAGTGASVVGFAGGVFILLHGASQASKGLTKIWTNKEIESVTSIAMQQLGVPKDVANTIDDMIVIVGTVGGSILKRTLTEGLAEQAIKEAIKESAESIPMAGKTKLGAKEIELVEKGLVKSHNVWDLDPIVRGIEIENILAKTDYKDWFRVGQLDNGKFPLVDFQKENIFVSLKTVDTRSKGWLNRMKEHIKQFGQAEATVSGNPAHKMLDIRVQPGGLDMKKAEILEKIAKTRRGTSKYSRI